MPRPTKSKLLTAKRKRKIIVAILTSSVGPYLLGGLLLVVAVFGAVAVIAGGAGGAGGAGNSGVLGVGCGTPSGQQPHNVDGGCPFGPSSECAGAAAAAITGTDATLRPDQLTNAKAIAGVALQRGLGRAGVIMGEMVGWTESTLINVSHGDTMGPSSRGLFQQMPAWGPENVRMDPAGSAGLFFDRLQTNAGWQSKPAWVAAQDVQGSEFNGSGLGYGQNYHGNYTRAVGIADALLAGTATPPAAGSASTAPALSAPVSSVPAAAAAVVTPAPGAGAGCTAKPTGGAVVANGPTITIPDKPDVPAAIRGKTIKAPTAAVATGLAAGFNAIGLPYVYGGGGDGGTPPTDGCDRARGAENSCQNLRGYDCSGLTAFVLGSAGFKIAAYSGAQRGGGTSIPRSSGMPGDIIGYDGHVAIYLGDIAGQGQFELEAPQPGTNVHIRAAYWSNNGQPADADLHRYWT